ncbi:hypothetical protein [Streptomyces sp. RPT161]|uniref:hypothetical protein n=1 Tax=Streptomyces sp. RPT161 TaxID=3015993 RepID=UPI0022B8E69A|nr:hypothetical protein [Streptomyces sp. RPT161]
MTYATSDVTADERGQTVLDAATAVYRQALGERLVSAYALGSLAHGGFASAVSDVDLALILDNHLPGDQATIDGTWQELRASGSPLHQRLSVFWSSLAALREDRADGRFPAIDRLDLVEHGRVLYGRDVKAGLPHPDRARLLEDSARFALSVFATDLAVDAFHQPAVLLDEFVRLTKIVLLPVRFLYTSATGRVGSTDEAADRYLAERKPVAAELVRTTMRWRHGHPFDREQATALLNAHLVPLYLHYIDRQLTSLTPVNPDLAAEFTRWRARLDGSQ